MSDRTRETPLTGKTKSGKVLTEQEELFCQTYVLQMGNGRAAAEAAYNIDKNKKNWKDTCSAIASENLRKPKLLERIREILDFEALTDEVVDNELQFLIKQSHDLSAKRGGLEIYNKLKARYKDHNIQLAPKVTVNVEKQKQIEEALEDV